MVFRIIGLFLSKTCIQPTFNLQKQLAFSFGITAMLTLFFTVGLSIWAAIHAGNNIVIAKARLILESQIVNSIATTNEYASDIITERINTFLNEAAIVVELSRDRISGYPTLRFWQDDLYVPFRIHNDQGGTSSAVAGSNQTTTATTSETNERLQRQYPLNHARLAGLLPYEWNITYNLVNDRSRPSTVYGEYLQEQLQERTELFDKLRLIDRISTRRGSFTFPRNCNPDQTNIEEWDYHPNCDSSITNEDDNNDSSPPRIDSATVSEITLPLRRKSTDLAIILKAIWESDPGIVSIGIYYMNDGYSATLRYPGEDIAAATATSSSSESGEDDSYVSIGCDWMLTTINPYTQQPLATPSQVEKCHPTTTIVDNLKYYNPLERPFCRDQAQHPGKTRIFGPYADTKNGIWKITFGQAIFDRITGHFIGCTAIDVSPQTITELLDQGYSNRVDHTLALVQLGGGSGSGRGRVAAGADWDSIAATSLPHLSETKMLDSVDGDPNDAVNQLLDIVKWAPDTSHDMNDDNENHDEQSTTSGGGPEKEWDPKEVRERYAKNYQRTKDGTVIMGHPVPNIPHDMYDPTYAPQFLIVSAARGALLKSVDAIEEAIDNDATGRIIYTIVIATSGLFALLAAVWIVSTILTTPLDWMEKVAWRIVNHSDKRAEEELRLSARTGGTEDGGSSDNASLRSFRTLSNSQTMTAFSRWTPNTEITELVVEFQSMIANFSGEGASKVAPSAIQEVKNCLTWQYEFQQLYDKDKKLGSANHSSNGENGETRTSIAKRLSSLREIPTIDATELDKLRMEFEESMFESINESNKIEQPMEEDSAQFRSAEMKKNSGSAISESIFSNNESSAMFSRRGIDSGFESTRSVVEEERLNMGSNLMFQSGHFQPAVKRMDSNVSIKSDPSMRNVGPVDDDGNFLHGIRMSRSRLFRWIVGLIALPLLLTNTLICAFVARDILQEFPQWVDLSRSASEQFEIDSLRTAANLRALYTGHVLSGPLRDLSIVTRVAGWLLLDAVGRSDSLTEIETELAEECKVYPGDNYLCPYHDDDSRSACDCDWKDDWNRPCDNFNQDTRDLQKAIFFGQALDFDPETGNRYNVTSYPSFGVSPETTRWFSNISQLPGSDKGSGTSGYNTTYDRIRSISPLAVVAFPLYNAVTVSDKLKSHASMSSMVFFDFDGSGWGYSGCYEDYAFSAHFRSTASNEAFELRPELCPAGKFGYDARCRPWYRRGEDAASRGDPLHVTPPYRFAYDRDEIGSSAVAPIFDTRKEQLLGLTLTDLSPTRIIQALNRTDSHFHTLVSSATDAGDDDTVVGPGFQVGDDPKAITDVVLPYDYGLSISRELFLDTVGKMKVGESGDIDFERTNLDGSLERVRMAYAPVYARGMSAVAADDLARGVSVKNVLLYSVGLARLHETITRPFDEVEDDINDGLAVLALVYLLLVGLVSLLCVIFTAKISIAVTKPMMILLQIVQNVNNRKIEDDIPPLVGGSREVNQVYISFAKLYKIVRISNSAFFSGNLKWAYDIANDGLKLFQKICDEKAIAIALNNIGNILFAMSLDRPVGGGCSTIDGICCVKLAIDSYDEAIAIAVKDFEADNDDDAKTDYARVLADRLFNRGLFYLHAVADSCAPPNARELGYSDLAQARALDAGVREYWLQSRQLFQKSGIMFERLIRRLNGLAALRLVDDEIWNFWDVNNLVDEADLMLTTAWKHLSAPLFTDIDRVGRLQQLEGVVMRLELVSGRVEEAAQLGMRMLVEDEYIMDSAFVVAAESLLRFQRSLPKPWPRKALRSSRRDIRKMLKSVKNCYLDTGKCVVFCFELGEKWDHDHNALDILNKACLNLYDNICSTDDYVGVVAVRDSADGPEIIEMSEVEGPAEAERRQAIDFATQVTDGARNHGALTTAVKMVTDSVITLGHDTFVLYISDGTSPDTDAYSQTKMELSKLNARRGAKVHMITIAFEIIDLAIAEKHKQLSEDCRGPLSAYLEATRDTADHVMEKAGELMSSQGTSRIDLGISMEKF